MELLPIIYISLAIFSVVAVATIIISFITYKIKQKTGNYKHPYEKEDNSESDDYMSKKLIDSEGKIYKAASSKKSSSSKKRKKESLSPRQKKEKYKSKGKSGVDSGRIKIVNEMPGMKKRKKADPPKEDKMKKSLEILGDEVIDKYADDENDDLFTPKIPSKEKGKRSSNK